MKLLFDHHLSLKIVKRLADLYPESNHVYPIGLAEVEDKDIWEYARQESFLIVTKDADFSDLSLLLGFPPKVIWIRRGNCSTSAIEEILRQHYGDIEALYDNKFMGVLTLF